MSFDVDLREPSGFDVALSSGGPVIAGLVKVWSGSAWQEKPAKVWSGSAWVQRPVKHWDGAAWVS